MNSFFFVKNSPSKHNLFLTIFYAHTYYTYILTACIH